MATKLYLESTTFAPVTPTPDSGWTDTTQFLRYAAGTTKAGSAMSTLSCTDATSTQQDIIIGQWISHPLTAGQTITGAQTIQIVVRCSETANNNNLFLSWKVSVISGITGAEQKVLVAKRNDGTEVVTSLTSRTDSATSTAGNYTTVTHDRIVVEIGLEGDPTGSNTHNGSISIGSSAGSDLAYSDGVTTANNPSINLNTDTLTFTTSSPSPSVSPSSSASPSVSPSSSQSPSVSPSSSVSPSVSPSASASPSSSVSPSISPSSSASPSEDASGFFAVF